MDEFIKQLKEKVSRRIENADGIKEKKEIVENYCFFVKRYSECVFAEKEKGFPNPIQKKERKCQISDKTCITRFL